MSACIHCDQDVTKAIYLPENPKTGPFCCWGCLTVYNVIHQKGLDEYYEIKKNVAFFKSRAPVEISSTQYSYLDDPQFLSEYSYKTIDQTMEFYLEGIHCLACLWIIEKLPEFHNGIKSTKLNIAKSVVTVALKEDGHFSEVARELDNLGYRPHPLKINQNSKDLKIKEERTMLLRIGIAGAAAGNIMLYAVSLYAGATAEYEKYFNLLTVLFAIPVLTYSAYPFYRTSWQAIKNKTLSIDIPISLALIMGGVMGIYNLLTGVNENYFDSLSALVFLLLLSRYFLKTIQELGLESSDLHYFYQGDSVLKVDDLSKNITSEIHPKFIKKNDLIKIFPNQLIPADAVIISGKTYLNNSLLTGESELQKVGLLDEVFSGTMNMGQEIIIKVIKINSDTRLGNILKSIENGWGQKAKIVDITNLISKYFVFTVFCLSTLLFFWSSQTHSMKHALEQALTLLIVTCPCALAIATPLTFIRTLSKAAQRGIIIKDDSVIETLSQVQNVFLDKTGTITQNNLEVSELTIINAGKISIPDIIYNLEINSRHPKAISLKNYIKDMHVTKREVIDLKETPNLGVSGIINGIFYEIKNQTIYEAGNIIATFIITDQIRSDALESITKLKAAGLQVKILSGDKKEYVSKIAKIVNLNIDEYASELSPEEKNHIIKSSKHSVMVGDGANDAIALSSADTGIAVFGAMDISLRAADVYLSLPGLMPVIDLITISKETMKVVYRNLVLSLCYNSVSVVLAFTGY
ncbi:MAG: cation-translocating P-type ATPase, partial [Bdellovibrionales bacterium]|nr:cation-translocating P-type ATPase [Bdellovibrionales bacterium]